MVKQKQEKETEAPDKDIFLTKISNRNALILAIIGLIGTFITAYFGYLGNRPQQTKNETLSIESTFIAIRTESAKLPRDTTTGNVVVYPSCDCFENISIQLPFTVRLRWGANNAELAEEGANHISYSLVVNGKTISDISSYRKSAIFVQNPIVEGDPSNTWWVYWDYVVEESNEESIPIEVNLITLSSIDNGVNIIPKGTKEHTELHINIERIMFIE